MRKILFVALIAILVIPLAPAATAQEGAVFRTSGTWDTPPAWHGNHYVSGCCGTAWWIIWEPLFHYVPGDDSIVLRLAESFEESEDGLTSTVVLREGSMWHDGTPATAQDVWDSFAFEYSWNASVWTFLGDIEIVDDMTLIFHWKQPTPLTRQLLAGIQIRAPHHLYGEWAADFMEVGDDEEAKTAIWDEIAEFRPDNPIGTGPFAVDIVTESQMIFKKFEDHPMADNVAFDEVVVEYWSSNEAVWNLLQAGQVDAAHPSVTPDITEGILASREGMEYVLVSDLGMFSIWFNPDMYDLAARQALAKVIDRSQMREVSFFYGADATPYATGVLATMEDFWLGADWIAENLTPYELDVETGMAELEELGLADANFTIGAPADYSDWVLACENLAQQLTNLGMASECQPSDGSIYWDELVAHDYDIAIGWFAAVWGSGNPYTYYTRLYGEEEDEWQQGLGITEPFEYTGPDGETVNVQNVTAELGGATTFEAQQPLVRTLAYVTNENLFALPYVEKQLGIFRAGDTITGWPEADDPLWTMCAGGIERFYMSLMVTGQLQPVQ
jgi:peptide/nickel transport system substrate-binding protein